MTDHVSGRTLQRAELARRTGCNLETIRYYEKTGMMPDPPRTFSGYRVYDDGHVSRLRFILRARELGFSIEQIRGLLDLVDGGTQTCAEVKERTERHLADVRAKIVDLERIEKVLAETAAQCSGKNVPECPVLEALTSGVHPAIHLATPGPATGSGA
jgi:Hg(II)-responsive transcriptional regulator